MSSVVAFQGFAAEPVSINAEETSTLNIISVSYTAVNTNTTLPNGGHPLQVVVETAVQWLKNDAVVGGTKQPF